MIVCDAASPLPEGTSHIVSMAFLAFEFRDLDLTQKSILFLTPSPRGVSAIRVTATMATVAPLAPTPPTRGSVRNGGIRAYPVIIRGLVMAGECPSQGRARGKTQSRTAPGQSMSNWGSPGCVVLSGRLRNDPGLKRLSSGGEGRVHLQGRKPLLKLPMSPPQTFLLYPLTSRQDLSHFSGANTLYSPHSKVSHPSGDISYHLTGGDGLVEQKTSPRIRLFPIKGQHMTSHT